MRGRKRTDEQWQALFDAYEDSGLNAAAFCREHGLPAPYFRTKYRQRSSVGGKMAFAKVQVAAPPAPVTIAVDGVQIRCDTSVACEWVAGLIRQVRA